MVSFDDKLLELKRAAGDDVLYLDLHPSPHPHPKPKPKPKPNPNAKPTPARER